MLFILSTLLVSRSFSSTAYNKEVIPSTSALCLDGTPSVIYVSKGIPDKILLHF